MKTILIFIFCVLITTSLFAQDENSSDQTSQKQPAYLFGQYSPNEITNEAEIQKIELFVLQIKNTSAFNGRIFVYKGVSDYKFNSEDRSNSIDNILLPLLEKNSIESYKVFSRFGGFREESTIEMIINPNVSEYVSETPTISLQELRFYDDSKLPKGTIQKTWKEILSSATKKVDPPYPAAARAVRALGEVGVLIKIDEKGNVIEAKAILGHPLLRAACVTAMRQSQFKPQLQNKIAVKVVGIGVCEFKPERYDDSTEF
jgi:TonB family protein